MRQRGSSLLPCSKHVAGWASSADTNPTEGHPKYFWILSTPDHLVNWPRLLRPDLLSLPKNPTHFSSIFVSTHFAASIPSLDASSVDCIQNTFVPILAFQRRRVELRRPCCFDLILSFAFVVHLFSFLDSSPSWCDSTPLPALF